MASLWRVDPATLVRSGSRRKIGRTALIDLGGLQEAIRNGQLGGDDVWVGTRRAQSKLEGLEWTYEDVLDCIQCLHPDDHKGAEWCEDSRGNWHPCDSYAIRYDHIDRCRVRHSDINYYLKFSLNEDGALTLVLISCHL